MRLLKVLLFGALLGSGAAYAGQDSTVEGSVETSPPESTSEQKPEQVPAEPDQYAVLEEAEVIYVYPVEVTEYYLIMPSESSESPG